MKKLSAILFENDNEEEVLSQPFLKDYKNLRLFHATTNVRSDIRLIPFKYRNAPRDTNRVFHDIVNEIALHKFDLPIRNLLFTYAYSNKMYGTPHVIVPVGANYRLFIANSVDDMTLEYYVKGDDDGGWEIDIYALSEILEQKLDELVGSKTVNKVLSYVDDNIYDNPRPLLTNAIMSIQDELDDEPDEEIAKDIPVLEEYNEEITSMIVEWMEYEQRSHLETVAESYVENVEEMSPSTYDTAKMSEEIMVYAPDGFYVIPINIANMLGIID